MKSTFTDRGYVLHLRPYREHSGLINIFTYQYGRLNAVVHGIHKNTKRSLYQLYIPIICTWKGKGDLKQIISIEIKTVRPPLIGKQLLWGLYLNELICKLIPVYDPYQSVFTAYEKCLNSLTQKEDECSLRYFELSLIQSLGYGLPTSLADHVSHFQYYPTKGLCPANQQGIPKEHIQALIARKIRTQQELKSSKIILKSIIEDLLGAQSIQTRKLVTPWSPPSKKDSST
ncbi:MAG TPA: DNA repair protein RecO [Gammaproteobacteria bacterium]|nr:DNA repair protein RecO [Gammaproteobacteria bacterium]